MGELFWLYWISSLCYNPIGDNCLQLEEQFRYKFGIASLHVITCRLVDLIWYEHSKPKRYRKGPRFRSVNASIHYSSLGRTVWCFVLNKSSLQLFCSFPIWWFWWKNNSSLCWKRPFYRPKSYFPFSEKSLLSPYPKKEIIYFSGWLSTWGVCKVKKTRSFPSVGQSFHGSLIGKCWCSNDIVKLRAIITWRDERPWHSFEIGRFDKLFSATPCDLPGVPGGLHGCGWQEYLTQNPAREHVECKDVHIGEHCLTGHLL